MKLRSFSVWLTGLTVLFFLFTGCATAKNPNSETRIIAIGDLHGDYNAFQQLLTQAGLIDHHGKWVGRDTILVQTGDVPDRGPDSLKIIKHLQKLQKQARRKKGRVVTLVGNHEAMNMIGDLRYVHPGEYKAFATRKSVELRERTYESNLHAIEAFYLHSDASLSTLAIKEKWFKDTPLGKVEHQTAWRPNGEVGRWIAGNPAVAIIGDSLFVHGGISQKYAPISVEDINSMTATALDARSIDPASIINDSSGPLWYRGNVRGPEDGAAPNDANIETEPEPNMDVITGARLSQEEEIDLVLGAYGVSRIVVGHTPSLQGVKASFGGKVIQIDTGISAYYGGAQSFLEIRNGILYAHDNGVVTIIGDDQNEEEMQ
jgi:Calcineurin-like phosphoesterase